MTAVEHDLHERIATIPLLATLSKKQRKRLLGESRKVTHNAGHAVAIEGAGSLALHVILEGSATVSVGGAVKRTLGVGDHFGEISLLDGRPRSATVVADGALTTLAIPHLAFKDILDDDPAVARSLLVVLCERLREADSAD